jgi:conjugal transfer pilus assembly protein TraD
VTADYVLENFGKTIVTSVQHQHSTSTTVEGEPLNYNVSYGARSSEASVDAVPREALGSLPDLEYFASFSGRSIVKGRIPLLRPATAAKPSATDASRAVRPDSNRGVAA